MTKDKDSEMTATLTEFQNNPLKVLSSGQGSAVAIRDGQQTVFYCLPSDLYQSIIERLDDLALNDLADARQDGPFVAVNLTEI